MFFQDKSSMVTPDEALPGRDTAIFPGEQHFVLGTPILPPYPADHEQAIVAMGCFWGAERCFWPLPGVYSTSVGYCAGFTKNPGYREVCTGKTGHTEAVSIIFDPIKISYTEILTVFWESHDPTQGMAQGNDRGTQYRSGIYTTTDGQADTARESSNMFQQALNKRNLGKITTEIIALHEYYFAEDYHQQYLAKNPGGYCGLGGTGVCFSAA